MIQPPMMGQQSSVPVMGQISLPRMAHLPNISLTRNSNLSGPSVTICRGPSTSSDLTLSSRLNLPPGTVATVVNSATVNIANNNPDPSSSSTTRAPLSFSYFRSTNDKTWNARQGKRKHEFSDDIKHKKVKEIESYLNDSAQSLLESETQELELEEKLQVKKALFESRCVEEKLQMDERQQRDMENLLEGHTLESQKLDQKHVNGRKKIADDHELDKISVKERICETKSIIKSLKLKLGNMTTSPMLNCPECPICFDSFQPPKKLVQCVNGHMICLECKQKPQVQECPTCREQLTGRATAYEQLLSQVFGSSG